MFLPFPILNFVGTTNNHHTVKIVHQQEPASLSPNFYLVAPTRQIPSTGLTAQPRPFSLIVHSYNPYRWLQELSNGSMTQATTLQTLIQGPLHGNTHRNNFRSAKRWIPKSYKRASKIKTSLIPPTITHSS